MTIWQIFFWILQILLVVILGALQFIDKESLDNYSGFWGIVLSFFFYNRLIISIIVGFVIAVLTGWSDLYRPRRQAKEIRQEVMEAMLEELFKKDELNTRITIFKDANLWNRIRINTKQIWRERQLGFDHYVYISERLIGKDYPKSKTYFQFNPNEEKGCVGIATVARHRGEDVIVRDLPNLEHIDLNDERLENKNTKISRLVRRYMRESYLGDDIDALKRINRKAKHIYGNILSNKYGEYKGVLVIDSFQDEFPFDESVRKNISYYIKIIASTL